MLRCLALAVGALVALGGPASASPNVSLDDPRYEELAIYHLRALLPLYRGGVAPLTETRVRKLLVTEPLPRRGWLRIDRALVRGALDADRFRPYSTSEKPRLIAGGVAVTCEHAEGRPCIGNGALGEIDGSAGYGDYVSGTLRLRANAGSRGYDADLAIDRLYVHGGYGPVEAEIGRDVLVVGPRSRTQLGWGDHAAALDHVRLSTSEPFPLTDSLRGNVLYAVARLRDPQRYDGGLLTISRVQLDIVDRVEVGVQQLLMLGGEGAPAIGGPIDFVLEHLRRRDLTATETDSSNRRFGGDVAWTIPELRARVYYQLMFEDIRRKYLFDAVKHDADHLWGVETLYVTAEYQRTGVRSHEHSARITGLTNAGRIGGSPLGQDASSLFIRGRIALPKAVIVYPWFEFATLRADDYSFVDYGPITHVDSGPSESRTRVGVNARVKLPHGLWLEPQGLVEYVDQFGFQRGTERWNARLAVDLVWRNPW